MTRRHRHPRGHSPSPSAGTPLSRRDLLKTAGLAGAALALPAADLLAATPPPDPALAAPATMMGVPFERRDEARIAVVGVGGRGSSVVGELLGVEGARITALCDVVPAQVQKAAARITAKGFPAPAQFTAGERDFERLVQRDDIDLVYTATPWEWHVPVCLAAMKAGKHAATECPAAMTLDDCWELVKTSEATRRHCLQLENCTYGFNEMLVNTMVKAGVFGDVLYAEAAYIHDLRSLLFSDEGEGLWRRAPHTTREGNFYPTHGLGPVSWYLDIHKGDRFDYLVSMATPEHGLSLWREAHVPKSSPKWAEKYIAGDIDTSLIRTVRGKTILLQHTVTCPTPYSRLNSIRATKGVFLDYPPRFYLDGQKGGEQFVDIDGFKADYTHPLWKQLGAVASGAGHGGMDYIMAWRLVQCMREGLPPDYDVYDAAAWSAPWPLSETSLRHGSAPVRFPDFTRGAAKVTL
jgi:hypothetical protein